MTATPQRLLVARMWDDISELPAYDRNGAQIGEIELSGTGTVEALHGSRTAEEAVRQYQSFDRPKSIMRSRGDSKSRSLGPICWPALTIDAERSIPQEWVESEDGTEIPIFVVCQAGLALDGSRPTVLYAYGGFEQSLTPEWKTYVALFLEDGGVFAVANCRGGGEFGKAWHEADRHERKQRSLEAVHAAADHIVDPL